MSTLTIVMTRNENQPKWTKSDWRASITDRTQLGAVIATVSATDKDEVSHSHIVAWLAGWLRGGQAWRAGWLRGGQAWRASWLLIVFQSFTIRLRCVHLYVLISELLYVVSQDKLRYEITGPPQAMQYYYLNPDSGVITLKKLLKEGRQTNDEVTTH